jgi:YD repeat-containing protein
MKQVSLLLSLLILSSGTVYAQRPERVTQAIRDRYGSMQTDLAAPRDINGIKVYEVDVRGQQGTSIAYVTEYGDFLSSGIPTTFNRLPEAVRDMRDLFRSRPENVDAYISDNYFIDVRRPRGEQVYRLRYDAVGRLREIINPDEVSRGNFLRFEKAGKEEASRVADAVRRQVPEGARLEDAFRDPRYSGFTVLRYTRPDGHEFAIIGNEEGAVISTKSQVDIRDIPRGIRESFSQTFDPDRVASVWHGRTQYYQFQQRAGYGEMATLRVRPDGSVIDVRSTDMLEEERSVLSRQRDPFPPQDRGRGGR